MSAGQQPLNSFPAQSTTLTRSQEGSILERLQRVARDFPSWDGGLAHAIVAKAIEPGTRRHLISGAYGVGRPTYCPFPSPMEGRFGPTAWVETTSDLFRLRDTPETGIETGLLVEPDNTLWPGLLSVRLVLAPPSYLPIVVPVRVLIDPNGYDDVDDGSLGFADFLRERAGIPTSAGATRAKLLEQYDHVRMLENRIVVRCPAGPGAVCIRDNIEPYAAIAEYGYGGLEGAFAATAIQIDKRALGSDVDAESRAARMLVNYAIGRADFVATSALRLAAVQANMH